MNKNVLSWLSKFYLKITEFLFGGYFLILIILNLMRIEIGKELSFGFFLIMGFYLGCQITIKVINYLQKNQT